MATPEQDYDALSRALNREIVNEEARLGMTIDDMQLQMAVLKRQIRRRRGYHAPTGPSGPTGPATGPATGP